MNERLFIGIPVYGQVPYEFMQALSELKDHPPCNLVIKLLPGDSLVSRARNTITAEFLKSDCSHLLFIDSDLIFSSAQIRLLLDANRPVVGGFYPKKKQGPVEWVCNSYPGLNPPADGLQLVRYIGTGFMMVRREVLEQMIAKHGEQIAYHPDQNQKETEYDLWPVGVYRDDNGFQRYLSEDWFFCQRWLDMGGEVFGHVRVILRHIGHAIYPLQTQIVELLPKNENTENTAIPDINSGANIIAA